MLSLVTSNTFRSVSSLNTYKFFSSIAPSLQRSFNSTSDSSFASMTVTRSRLDVVPGLISAKEIIGILRANSSGIKFVDGSWHMNKERKPLAEFVAKRIVGAQYFDIDEISDKSSGLPHMLPSATVFSEVISKMGISNDDHVYVYVTNECFSAARVWWTFKAFGHNKVSVIDGGIEEWMRESGPTEHGDEAALPEVTNFKAELNTKLVVRMILFLIQALTVYGVYNFSCATRVRTVVYM